MYAIFVIFIEMNKQIVWILKYVDVFSWQFKTIYESYVCLNKIN